MQPQLPMMQNSDELAKMMSQYQQKTAQSGANFNGAHMQQQYNPDQLGNLSNKNLSADNNESDDGKKYYLS